LTQLVHSIEARNLTKSYSEVPAITDLSFTVAPGEVVGFLGPNGAGKSTTLRILSGLLRANKGEAYIQGISVARYPERIKPLIGYMPENNPLPDDLRVIEYLKHRAHLKGLRGKKCRDRVESVLEQCDLARTVRRKLIGALSKGFRQRVGIADAILAEPAVTILDEPTIGLDPHQIIQIRKLIERLRGRSTIILSSHILAEVEVSCDRVIIINQGHIVASGTPHELRTEFFPKREFMLQAQVSSTALRQALQPFGDSITISERSNPLRTIEEHWPYYQLSLPKQSSIQSDQLLQTLTQNNISIREIHLHQPTLEDIFFAATKRSWELEIKSNQATNGTAPKETTPPDPS